VRPLRHLLFFPFIVFGLLLAQWQGFSHGIDHGLKHDHHFQSAVSEVTHVCEEHLASSAWHSGDAPDGHHCAAYDSQTLSLAMPALPLMLKQMDLTHALIKAYSNYQVSIEAYRPFDVRGPPRS
jgi:hypothetical protein